MKPWAAWIIVPLMIAFTALHVYAYVTFSVYVYAKVAGNV